MNRQYVVPDGARLVIESVYAEVTERHAPEVSGRSGVVVGVETFYDLGRSCAYPGYQRNYGVLLTEPVVQTGAVVEISRSGHLDGPIYVEGGRTVNGLALAPNGDDEVLVSIVAHGYLEPSRPNPPAPVCGGA